VECRYVIALVAELLSPHCATARVSHTGTTATPVLMGPGLILTVSSVSRRFSDRCPGPGLYSLGV
jgi:hypothetical protein